MRTNKTFSIYRSYKNDFDESDLNELARVIGDEMEKKVKIISTGDEDGYTLHLIIENE